MNLDLLVADLVREEGFRAKPYLDVVDVLTFGHGLTYITETESERIVRERCERLDALLSERLASYDGLTETRRAALVEMAYQLGMDGLKQFHMMLAALWEHEYEAAADAALDSKWAKQTPARAKRVSEMIRNG